MCRCHKCKKLWTSWGWEGYAERREGNWNQEEMGQRRRTHELKTHQQKEWCSWTSTIATRQQAIGLGKRQIGWQETSQRVCNSFNTRQDSETAVRKEAWRLLSKGVVSVLRKICHNRRGKAPGAVESEKEKFKAWSRSRSMNNDRKEAEFEQLVKEKEEHQKASKEISTLGAEGLGARRVGGPKFRAFFPSPANIFILSSLSWGSSRKFWCFWRPGPEMCTFGVLRLSCGGFFGAAGNWCSCACVVIFSISVVINSLSSFLSRFQFPVCCAVHEALGPPALHTTARELQTCRFQGPCASKHHQNSTRRHPREGRMKENCGGRRKKKHEILGPYPSGPLPSKPHPHSLRGPPFGAPKCPLSQLPPPRILILIRRFKPQER